MPDFQISNEPRYLPAYPISEAAHYLRVPLSTLRAWTLGQSYKTRRGEKRFRPVIELPEPGRPVLSFLNLVEAHVLTALRREHKVDLRHVRKALRFVTNEFQISHPLARQTFLTDGLDLFVNHYGDLLNASKDGQLALKSLLEAHLKRVEPDSSGLAARLFPFTRAGNPDEPRIIVIDPRVAFGRPALAGTSIPTGIIAERFKAGEGFDDLAQDYARPREEIEEAIRCELEAA